MDTDWQLHNSVEMLKMLYRPIPEALKYCTPLNFRIFKINLFFILISILSLRLYHYRDHQEYISYNFEFVFQRHDSVILHSSNETKKKFR